jgi:hypothetical protein
MSIKNETAEAILIVLRRIIWWVILGFISFIILIFLFIYSFKFNFEDYKPLKVINELNGITLEQTLSDFLFKNNGFNKEKVIGKDGKEDKSVSFYSNERYFVGFIDQKVQEIDDDCSNLYVGEVGANDIVCRDSSEKILGKYKDKIKVYCGNNNSRFMLAKEYNVAYTLKQNEVVKIQVSKNISLDKSWIDCKDYKL